MTPMTPRHLNMRFNMLFLSIVMGLMVGVTAPPPAQKFAIEPVDKTAIVNDTILLACRVVNKAGTLQWSRDHFGLGTDRDLAGYPRYTMSGNDEEGDFSLQIRNVNLEDDAKFQCQVGASEGVRGIRSRDATLTVFAPPDPPTIVEGDLIKTKSGQEVTVSCEAMRGKPAAELTWLDGEGNAVPSEEVTYTSQGLSDGKRANAKLVWTFKATKDHHGKSFTCRSENSALKKPQRITTRIEVKYPPEVKLVPDRDIIHNGQDVTFTCEASANPDNMIYKWYKNEVIIVGDHSTTYTVRNADRDSHEATITCEVSNSMGTSKASHTIAVNFGPHFRTPLKDVHGVSLGQEVRLTCDVTGNPEPEIAWLLEGSTRVLSTESQLVIPDMSYDQAGTYLCRASVRGFPEISATTQVFIKGPPRVTSPTVQYGAEREPIKIECLVQSVPPPSKVSWTRNSKMIDMSQGYEQLEEKSPSSSSLVRNLLVIHNPKPEDFGIYNCSAENEFGNDFITIELSKQRSLQMVMSASVMIIASVVLVVPLTIAIIIMCMRSKATSGADYGSDIKKDGTSNNKGSKSSPSSGGGGGVGGAGGNEMHRHHQQHLHAYHPSTIDTGSSGAESDVKVDIRTSSSLSERPSHWEDGVSDRTTVMANEMAQVVDSIYNYTHHPQNQPQNQVTSNHHHLQPAAATSQPNMHGDDMSNSQVTFTNKMDMAVNPSTGNNNGYVPYVDYNREYLPPPSSSSSTTHLLHGSNGHIITPPIGTTSGHHIYPTSISPQHHGSILMTGRESYDPYGSVMHCNAALVDPRYGRFVTPSYVTNNPRAGAVSFVGQSNGHSPSHMMHSVSNSNPYGSLQSNPNGAGGLYITSTGTNHAPIKPGTLATHV